MKVQYGGIPYRGVNATLEDLECHLQAYCAAGRALYVSDAPQR